MKLTDSEVHMVLRWRGIRVGGKLVAEKGPNGELLTLEKVVQGIRPTPEESRKIMLTRGTRFDYSPRK
jgi:hypothetical protein